MKLYCTACAHTFDETLRLSAPHPFRPEETIIGCPGCREPETATAACDAVGCHARATSGMPTREGYRHTCHRHRPPNQSPPVTGDL